MGILLFLGLHYFKLSTVMLCFNLLVHKFQNLQNLIITANFHKQFILLEFTHCWFKPIFLAILYAYHLLLFYDLIFCAHVFVHSA